MYCSEAVTQQVFGIQPFNIFKFFRQVALWSVIAKDVFNSEPDALRTEEDATLEVLEGFQLFIRVGIFGQDLPDIPGTVSNCSEHKYVPDVGNLPDSCKV